MMKNHLIKGKISARLKLTAFSCLLINLISCGVKTSTRPAEKPPEPVVEMHRNNIGNKPVEKEVPVPADNLFNCKTSHKTLHSCVLKEKQLSSGFDWDADGENDTSDFKIEYDFNCSPGPKDWFYNLVIKEETSQRTIQLELGTKQVVEIKNVLGPIFLRDLKPSRSLYVHQNKGCYLTAQLVEAKVSSQFKAKLQERSKNLQTDIDKLAQAKSLLLEHIHLFEKATTPANLDKPEENQTESKLDQIKEMDAQQIASLINAGVPSELIKKIQSTADTIVKKFDKSISEKELRASLTQNETNEILSVLEETRKETLLLDDSIQSKKADLAKTSKLIDEKYRWQDFVTNNNEISSNQNETSKDF